MAVLLNVVHVVPASSLNSQRTTLPTKPVTVISLVVAVLAHKGLTVAEVVPPTDLGYTSMVREMLQFYYIRLWCLLSKLS